MVRAAILDQRIVGTSYGWEGTRNASPSVRRVNGSVVRRNLANKPAGTSDDLNPGEFGFRHRWAGVGGSQEISLLTGIQGPAGTGITTAVRKTFTVIGTSLLDVAFGNNLSGVNGYPVTPGDVYTVSSYWRVSRTQNSLFVDRPVVTFYDSSGAKVSNFYEINHNGPIVADKWNRAYTTVTVPKNAAYVSCVHEMLFPDNTSLQVGDTLDATGLLVEKSSLLRPYFDGGTQVNAATINGVTPL